MPAEPIHLRCSGLPLALACPASRLASAPIDSADPSAAVGSAVHEVLANRLAGHALSADDAARRFGADPDEVSILTAWAWRSWQLVAGHFPDPKPEEYFELENVTHGVKLTGHIDVLSVTATDAEVRIADFKTGRLDEDFADQLRGYAYLAIQHHPTCIRAYVATIRVRDQVLDGAVYTRMELEDWWQRALVRVQQTDTFTPGPHCRYCPRRAECPAQAAHLRQAMATLGQLMAADDAPPSLGDVYDAVKSLETSCEDAKAVLRFQVSNAGGSITLPDGRALVLTAQQQRSIDPRHGLPVLREHLSETEIEACLTIGKGKVEDAIRARAGRGEKTRAVKELMDRLDGAGALTTKTIERLECKRAPQLKGTAS